MKRLKPWIGPIAAALVIAVGVHVAVVLAAPGKIMAVAMDRIGGGGDRINRWSHAPRTSIRSRNIVRPSPDLAYSSCVYDLSAGPVRITAPRWDDYASLSIFAANTDNFYVINYRQMPPGGADIVLIQKGAAKPATPSVIVESPSARGIALLRYLAPTAERFKAAAAVRASARCEPWKG